MTTELNIAQRLKDLRAKFNFTQDTVSAEINMKRTSYQAYEEGRAVPPLDILLKLTELYGCSSIDELLGIAKTRKEKRSSFQVAYYCADPEKRKIIDFILNLNC